MGVGALLWVKADSHPRQGEDGFPGFKGDMGIKGDRVSVQLGKGRVAQGPGEGCGVFVAVECLLRMEVPPL